MIGRLGVSCTAIVLFFSVAGRCQDYRLQASDSATHLFLQNVATVSSDIESDQLADVFESLLSPRSTTATDLADLPWVTMLDARSGIFDRTQELPTGGSAALRMRFGYIPGVERMLGATDGEFLGSPLSSSSRLTIERGQLSAALLVTKRAWEPNYTDRISGFVQLDDPVTLVSRLSISRAVVGDFQYSSGEGLLFGTPLGGHKSLETIAAVESHASGVRGYTTGSSFATLRGAATSLVFAPFSMDVIFSRRPIDATTDSSGLAHVSSASLYRTNVERAAMNNLTVSTRAARASWRSPDSASTWLTIGASAALEQFSPSIVQSVSPGALYGDRDDIFGVDAELVAGTFATGVEVARSETEQGRGIGLIGHIIVQPARDVAMSLNYRHLPATFISYFGHPFSESGDNNEEGVYLGGSWKAPNNLLSVRGYVDVSSTFLSPYLSAFPGDTKDALVEFTSHPISKEFGVSLLLHDKTKAKDAHALDPFGRAITLSGDRRQTNLRLTADSRVSGLRCVLQGEYVRVHHSAGDTISSSGLLGLARIEFSLATAWKIELLGGYYHTDAYDSRLYVYEPQTPTIGILSALYHTGEIVATRITLQDHADYAITAFASASIYSTPRAIGLGPDQRVVRSETTAVLELDLKL